MIYFNEIKNVVIHFSCWFLGFFLAFHIMHDSDARLAYAIIIGWWFACYFGYVLKIDLKAIVPVFLLYFFVCVLSFIFDNVWFYHSPILRFDLQLMLIVMLQSFVIVSPILFNSIVRKVVEKTEIRFADDGQRILNNERTRANKE